MSLIIEHWDSRQYNGVGKNEVILGKENYYIELPKGRLEPDINQTVKSVKGNFLEPLRGLAIRATPICSVAFSTSISLPQEGILVLRLLLCKVYQRP